ncbi:MAG: hypothetical protein QHD01_31825 [Bradyrhizobium sp.]|uniref:hypothetical protein n=1 Tax=Bradyrhizobium sp. TaxID=376 RepID=UPI0029B3EF9F|nr:hypothetical protein [Bradyrhizobium sp.]MDX3971159.1 hypothetical protein [Bradyrhizobium sp.]
MLHVATCLWQPNDASREFSRCYDESWVDKLYRGVARNLSYPFRFVLFTDEPRAGLPYSIEQMPLKTRPITYGSFTEPYQLGKPMILMGLDTVITGNIDHLAEYCLLAGVIALPRDPYSPQRACNGVALVPPGQQAVYETWRGENDMDWIRRQPHAFIDDLFPGHVVSFKGHVRDRGLGDARIVYFHGHDKPHEIVGAHAEWVREHWQ